MALDLEQRFEKAMKKGESEDKKKAVAKKMKKRLAEDKYKLSNEEAVRFFTGRGDAGK